MESGNRGVGGKAGVVAACWESGAGVDNKGQDEEGGSCRQVEGSVVSQGGRVEEEAERGSPLDIGCVVCKRTPLNWTEVAMD